MITILSCRSKKDDDNYGNVYSKNENYNDVNDSA